jgi:hypothetical protein
MESEGTRRHVCSSARGEARGARLGRALRRGGTRAGVRARAPRARVRRRLTMGMRQFQRGASAKHVHEGERDPDRSSPFSNGADPEALKEGGGATRVLHEPLDVARTACPSLLGLDHHAPLSSTIRTRSVSMSALGQSRQVFEILSKTLGFVPIIGDNLKSAAELASKICEEIEVREGLHIILYPLSHYLRAPVDHPRESRRLQAPRDANQRSPPHHLGRRQSGEGSRGEARGKEATRREPKKVRLRIIREDSHPVNTSSRSGCLKKSRLPFVSVSLLILPRPKDPAAFSPP